MKRTIFIFTAVIASLTCVSWMIADYTWATYPGGKAAMEKFIKDSLRYPDYEKKEGLESIVSVSFEITKEGAVANPNPVFISGSSKGFLDESKRLVLSMPNWNPATKNGRPIAGRGESWVYFELPDSLVHLPPPSDDTTLYVDIHIVDSTPLFVGGESAMFRFIYNSVRYPQMEKEMGKMGTVYISYTVERNGKVNNVYAIQEVEGAPGLTRESIRVVNSLPRFRPAMIKGKAVRWMYVVPIKFTLI